MPLSRSPRTDRRRRTIRENLNVYTDGSDEGRISPSRTTRNAELPELIKKDRGAAYSHSVRGACQHRIVQFIPVRKISLAGAIAVSAGIPLILVVLHYLVFVSGTLNWSGHPMSALLNANSSRSLAAWMSSHLWLLCLAATVLTFRLRKHKLDDYDGDYRLWFWLVFTCLIGSIDSTTRLTELFGAALDRWSQLHVGWSGIAIVNATLATLVGMLGLRLCTELKAVPTSLVLWLVGLVCWAGSAALSQSLFHLEMSSETRAWMRGSLWLAGLTSIWLCSLFYLRATFMDAQKRFLSRAMASSAAIPWQQRLREAMPKLPRFGRAKSTDEDSEAEDQASPKRKRKVRPAAETQTEDEEYSSASRTAERRDSARPVTARESSDTDDAEQPGKKSRWSFGLGKLALRPPTAKSANNNNNDNDQDAEVDREYGKKSGWFGRRKEKDADAEDREQRADTANRKAAEAGRKPARDQRGNDRDNDQRDDADAEDAPRTKRTLRERFGWSRQPTEEQIAAREAKQAAKQSAKEARQAARQKPAAEDDDESTPKRSWLRIPKPKLPKLKMPRPKLPKLKLPSFRLPPPTDNSSDEDGSSNRTRVPNVDTSRPLPGTSNQRTNAADQDLDDNNRNLSKAERKRLKRLQREEDNDRRAA